MGFRAGLFNIGAEGQFFMGSLGAAFVGYSLVGWPLLVHLPLAILGGFLVGAIWGAIPGWLKAKTGGHEVVNTIMMNYIAYRLSDCDQRSDEGARLPTETPTYKRPRSCVCLRIVALQCGLLLAVVAGLVFWLLFKTTISFTIRG